MYIEDLLMTLYQYLSVNRYDKLILNNFVGLSMSGTGLTEKQSQLAVKMLKRYSKNLSSHLGKNVNDDLIMPQFRYPVRKTKNQKTVSIIDHQIYSKAIKLEIPYNQEIINSIRQNRSDLGFANWDSDTKSWIFSLDEKNLNFLSKISENYGIVADEEIQGYFDQTKNILNAIEEHIPMLSIIEEKPVYKNVSNFVPKLETDNVISALFEARLSGIFTWDDKVSEYLNRIEIDPLVKDYFNHESSKNFYIDNEIFPVQVLSSIIQYTCPVLFIISPGDELKKTKQIFDLLINMGYSTEQISVMFRLSNNEDKDFNSFVKDSDINNQISDKTLFVFVSAKMPKPVLQSNLRFNNIIVMGRLPHHSSIREYTKNKPNLIFYCESNKNLELNFGDL